ncbi:hypothetical protein [Pantanalinema sp. GBBB05]|uniref:hypothetical protein n=1 Tax=Pantanalinema sp. GBBB05 TaxID=2604139 RepID=UPI001D253CF5|nr:hypothetical protein [Pantanalinema sp. GBBB05]
MANRSRHVAASKVVPRSAKQIPPSSTVRISTPRMASAPKPAKRWQWGWFWSLLLLLAAGGGIFGSVQFSLQLIVNPQKLLWINQWIPGWIPTQVNGLKPPKTFAELRAEAHQNGQTLGEPLTLGKNQSALDNSPVTDVLIPVLAKRTNCSSHCERIVELRLYQASTISSSIKGRSEPHYQFVNQLPIGGLEESFVIAPLVDARSVDQGSSAVLPLTKWQRFAEKAPRPGVWLLLSGEWDEGDATIAYGQVLHYNPEQLHLSSKLQWTSPAGQLPEWQEITGGGMAELVVDQTIGMEPQFEIYQVKPLNFRPSPLQLEPISLAEFFLSDATYQTAITFARSGLWSESWQRFQSFKQTGKPASLTAQAQAQMDLIRWHSQATETQANQSWASPSQQVLADLIDGRWANALQVFESSTETSLETRTILKADMGRLEKRVKAALRINPGQLEAKTWGALWVAARTDRNRAILWLKKQPRTKPSDLTKITHLLQRLEASQLDLP